MSYTIDNVNQFPIVIPAATMTDYGVIRLSDIPSGGSLQSAYDGGNSIVLAAATPVEIDASNTGGETALSILGVVPGDDGLVLISDSNLGNIQGQYALFVTTKDRSLSNDFAGSIVIQPGESGPGAGAAAGVLIQGANYNAEDPGQEGGPITIRSGNGESGPANLRLYAGRSAPGASLSLEASKAAMYSPDGSTGSYQVTDSLVQVNFNGARVSIDSSQSVLASPNRSNNFTVTNSEVSLYFTAGHPRVTVLSASTDINSPDLNTSLSIIDDRMDLYFGGTAVGSIQEAVGGVALHSTDTESLLQVSDTGIRGDVNAVNRLKIDQEGTGESEASLYSNDQNSRVYVNNTYAQLKTVGVALLMDGSSQTFSASGTKYTINTTGVSWFGAAAVAQQAVAALTNNITAGGTDNQVANYTDLTVYANDATAIRNNLYQLARSIGLMRTAMANYGLVA